MMMNSLRTIKAPLQMAMTGLWRPYSQILRPSPSIIPSETLFLRRFQRRPTATFGIYLCSLITQ